MGEPDVKPARGASNLTLRVLSALVLIPVVLLAVYLGGFPFAAVIAVFVALAVLEWRQLTRGGAGWRPDIMALGALAAYAAAVAEAYPLAWIVVGLGSGALLVSSRLGAARALWQGFGLAYVMPLALALLWLREAPHFTDGALLIYWLLAVVWSSDTGAYFGGRAIGGPKLAPRISPGKTWSGALVGAAVGALAGTGFALLAIDAGGPGLWMICGLLLAAWSQLGDLFESGIKLKRKIKDSGAIIPGHGGVLDRVDSLAFAAPGLAFILWILE